MIYEHEDKHALSLKHWNTCHLIDSNTFLVPFLRQRSILSVMVILLSEMNSYRMRVAIAVLSPSSAPCLVLALRKKKLIYFIYLSQLQDYQKTLTSTSRVITISYKSIAGFFRMHVASFSRCIQPAITQQFLKDVALSGKQVEVN